MSGDLNPEQKRDLEGALSRGLGDLQAGDEAAAMGQQDCGQCGYDCQDYSDAIFLKKEERLNLCAPGGKETTRMLKALHQELGQAPAAAETPSKTPTPAAATVAPAAAPGCSHECPTEARFLSPTRLNKAGSAKETWHIEFDLTASGIDYAVGDAFGVFPTNDPAFVANLKKSGHYQQDVY